jgi:penicillin-binding protein 1A
MTAAYAIFGNHGKYIRPYGLIEVRNAQGNIIWRKKPEQRIAMSSSSAAIITNMLEGVIQRGTARRASVLPGSLAGKTGTTNKSKDALFIGYSPSLTAGVWVGNDDASSLGPKETGASAALPIWVQFMQSVSGGQENAYFDIPDDVTQIYIHPRTGKKAGADSMDAIRVLVRRSPVS